MQSSPCLHTRYNQFTPRPRTALTSLRLISYNIQVGIQTRCASDYITKGWQHILPTQDRTKNLNHIADVLKDFDIVALQETDSGSLRTRYVNQVEYLAEQAQFPYWHAQRNRNLGHLGQHSNGILSQLHPTKVENLKLPGTIPGRGAIMMQFGDPSNPLLLLSVHLALGGRSRRLQLECLKEITQDYEHIILMGDMNCSNEQLNQSPLLKDTELCSVNSHENTFPSWKPSRNIDHILLTPSLEVNKVSVLNQPYSDHLPIAIEINLPSRLLLV